MATSSSSGTSGPPSSSAVTIPIPGKSILKKPPPQQQSIFSRITRFLPTQNLPTVTTGEDAKPLKRAHFILPQIAIVYPISSLNPPSTPTLKEEKRAIEDQEAERRKKIIRGSPASPGGHDAEEWWSMDKVDTFYRECCAGCEEEPDPVISAAFKHASSTHPRTVDLSGVQLSIISASILSDVFTIEWGLRKLVFRECDLDDLVLKPMLHSLLIPNTLSFLSVASNRRMKAPSFRLLGAFVKKAKTMQFLDLSQNSLDKKSIEYIVAALETAPEPGLVSLRLDDCQLRPAALETLCRAVRTSSLKNISLRHNRISASGGVALALMIRDYPDVVPTPLSPVGSSASGTPSSSLTSSPTTSVSSLSFASPPATPSTPTISLPSPLTPRPGGPLPPPPKHPSSVGLQTTYTPYVPKARRGKLPPTAAANPLSPTGQPIPLITSSLQGGVTTRHPVSNGPASAANGAHLHHDSGPSAALLDKVRALDNLPRLGALRTLDLKGNDLRNGITYLAQVLKRNRTLKVLNLSENKLDVQCLVTIAEALKYNSCLETLDLNKNPCAGPGLEGIQSLRTAFTLNTALKRLFLSSTSMTSTGAIALAEFLPESTSLLHLDLTLNDIDIAGVMALSSGLKANHVMRCLDLNIPPGDEAFARMCREILNSCVRNTEDAERASRAAESGRGHAKGLWGMIEDSELAKSIRLDEEKKIESDVVVRARSYLSNLTAVVENTSNFSSATGSVQEVIAKAKAVVNELSIVIQETEDPHRLEDLLGINDQLLALLKKAPQTGKPNLKLQGLGLAIDSRTAENGDGMLDGFPHINGRSNIHATSVEQASTTSGLLEPEDEETTPTTPKIDKGKRKAEPEPEQSDMVLSPKTFMMNENTNEENPYPEEDEEEERPDMASPTDRSRYLVEEEGEVFRKGTALLGPEEMEGDYAGEELRKELLEAMVERPPPRPLTDEYGMELNMGIPDPTLMSATIPRELNRSPTVPPPPSESPKPSPRPYISRSRSSSNSILNMISPATPTMPSEPTISEGYDSPTMLSAQPPLSRTASS
ncbi:hypothetical protein CPB83DRAFT_904584 [Crepidotus variabilis]|uniref:RNI-like protein n=1 Tax=Crepidotus variabilis TaxID=179855 RepID=A0A9P6EM71_9AGAR|nr:hypothetical protein CPB83DRAFT_904584 [Crepidotus variabilis]